MEEFTTEQLVAVHNLPKKMSPIKFKKLLASKIEPSQWLYKRIIPLEEFNIGEIICNSAAIKEKFQQELKPYRIDNVSYPYENSSKFSELVDIIPSMPLKTQIELSRVCRDLHDIITDTWRTQYKTLRFSFYDFHIRQKLTAAELYDFLLSVGQHVSVLIFDTTPYVGLIEFFNDFDKWERINIQFCKYLMLFENVTTFQALESNFCDFTVRELARYCPRLREFSSESYKYNGAFLDLFKDLRAFDVEYCGFLMSDSLWRACRHGEMHALSFSLRNQIITKSYVDQLSGILTNVTSLRMTQMFDDMELLKGFLHLPNLQHLELSWPSSTEDLELKIMQQFSLDQKQNLKELKFRVSYPRMGKFKGLPIVYTSTDEKAAVEEPWLWHNRIDEYLQCFGEFSNLKKVSFQYCRPLTENLKELPRACHSLQEVKLLGCCDESDQQLQLDWRTTLDVSMRCYLRIVDMAPVPYKLIFFNGSFGQTQKPFDHTMDCYFS